MRYGLLLILWLVTDVLLFIAAYAAAYFLRVGFIFSTDFPIERYLLVVSLVAPFWLLALLTTRAFALTRNQRSLRSGAYILYAAIIGISLFTLGYYFLYGLFFSRLLLVYALMTSAGLTWAWHIAYDWFLRRQLRRDPPVFRALIVGVTRESSALIKRLQHRQNAITPVAILDGRGTKEKEIHGVPVFGKLNKLEHVLQEQGITHLIQCADLEQSINLLSACRQRGITYLLLPSVLGIVERDEQITNLEGFPVTMVNPRRTVLSWFLR